MTTTRNRALDRLRRRAMLAREHDALAADSLATDAHLVPDFVEHLDASRGAAEVGDELLRLIFIACHPTLNREAQVALTLRPRVRHQNADFSVLAMLSPYKSTSYARHRRICVVATV